VVDRLATYVLLLTWAQVLTSYVLLGPKYLLLTSYVLLGPKYLLLTSYFLLGPEVVDRQLGGVDVLTDGLHRRHRDEQRVPVRGKK